MVSIYRRHAEQCSHRSNTKYTRCACPVWAFGILGSEPIRESMKTRDWQEASKTITEWNALGYRPEPTPEPEAAPQPLTVAQACERFKQEMQRLRLRDSSQKKYRILFRQMDAYCAGVGLTMVSGFNLDHTEGLTETWNTCTPGSAGKRLERLRTVQAFWVRHGWLDQNHAKTIRPPKDNTPPTQPFSIDEVRRLLDGCEKLLRERPKFGKGKVQRLRALILLMRYSGLRIGDAASLRCDKLQGQKLFLYTAKTGTPVHSKLPQFVIDELDRCPRITHEYWFWTGLGKKETLTENYRRVFREVAKVAKIKNAHPHRLRDTFAVELLLAGVSLEGVSKLLGHTSIKVTERHYSPWIHDRQTQLEESLDHAISLDPLAQSEGRKSAKLTRIK